jgi:hypothetical protein
MLPISEAESWHSGAVGGTLLISMLEPDTKAVRIQHPEF